MVSKVFGHPFDPQKYGCKRIPGVINSTKLYDEVTSRESSDGIEMLGKRRTG